MIKDAAYWIALAHLPGWRHAKINSMIIKFYHELNLSIDAFFDLSETDWINTFGLDAKELADLGKAKAELGNLAFLAETMGNEGYELIPIISPEYSRTKKDNLKATSAPAVLYVKGNKQIMAEKSVAIVGSRNASEVSLEFTDHVAKLASKEYKVVVSGFAKGVDKQALDSAIRYKGQSIIVLPQGILTFGTGYKTYYKQIIEGDVLVLSTFFPKAPWRTELAMARNPIIYGLASEIYVAESSEKGGTWSGVMDGLRKGRTIYVRKAGDQEENANNLLISKGAIPVDQFGQVIKEYAASAESMMVNEPGITDEQKILDLLARGSYSAREIIRHLGLSTSEQQLRTNLKVHPQVATTQTNPLKFTLKSRTQQQISMFE